MVDLVDSVVDVLDIGTLDKTGVAKPIDEAARCGDWMGSFNLWIVRRFPSPSILYQQRAEDAQWAPGLLDATAGGHYRAGESMAHGLREVREELGKDYEFTSLLYLGKKLYMRQEPPDRKIRYIVDVFLKEDNDDLDSFTLQRDEVQALFVCPITQLLQVHVGEIEGFISHGVRLAPTGQSLLPAEIQVNQESFPFNWDRYHYRMAVLAAQYFRGERHLLY